MVILKLMDKKSEQNDKPTCYTCSLSGNCEYEHMHVYPIQECSVTEITISKDQSLKRIEFLIKQGITLAKIVYDLRKKGKIDYDQSEIMLENLGNWYTVFKEALEEYF